MSILSAVGPGQLQTIQHILQELEAEGVNTLTEARSRIFSEIKNQLAGRKRTGFLQQRRPQSVEKFIRICPHCRPARPMITIVADDDQGKSLVMQCQKCRYSIIVEGGQ
jgi:hypothetical protein